MHKKIPGPAAAPDSYDYLSLIICFWSPKIRSSISCFWFCIITPFYVT